MRYLFSLYYPDWLYYRERLSRFQLPLWTPYTGCGEPFLANGEPAVLYPLNLIFLFLPAGSGFVIFLIVHMNRTVPVVQFLRLEDPLPRAYVVGKVEILPDRETVFRTMGARPIDYGRVALVAREDCGLETFGDLSSGDVVCALRDVRYGTNQMTVRIDSAAPGLLVVSDTCYPGWVATVNGKETPIYKVNWTFRGIRVPGGESAVNMRYAPESFRIGAIVSVITLGILAVFFGWYVLKKK